MSSAGGVAFAAGLAGVMGGAAAGCPAGPNAREEAFAVEVRPSAAAACSGTGCPATVSTGWGGGRTCHQGDSCCPRSLQHARSGRSPHCQPTVGCLEGCECRLRALGAMLLIHGSLLGLGHPSGPLLDCSRLSCLGLPLELHSGGLGGRRLLLPVEQLSLLLVQDFLRRRHGSLPDRWMSSTHPSKVG